MKESLPRWDPSIVFPGPESEEVNQILFAIGDKSRRLSKQARRQLGELAPQRVLELIRRYEECVSELQLVNSYAELLHGLYDQGDSVVGLLSRCDEAWAQLAVELGFFESELAACTHLDGEHLGSYLNFVRKIRAVAQALPGISDEVLARLAPTGIEGWQRLAQQLLTRIRVDIDGVESGIGAALPVLYETQRDTRVAVHAAINRGLTGELELRATALNMIVADGEARAQLGGPGWLQARQVIDQVDSAEVSALISAAVECNPVVAEYYDFKRSAMGLDFLADYDRYAPIYSADAPVTWSETTEVVLASLGRIHPEFRRLARRMLDMGAIDAAPRIGKQRNASTRAIPGHLPCISMNFTGKLRDILTLSHEMGHAVHMQLAAEQPFLAATPPTVLGETVALFCEAVTVRELLIRDSDTGRQAAFLARWLEEQIVAIGRHGALHLFEVELRRSLRDDGPLTADRIGRLWLEGQRRLYGTAVELTDGYAMWWSYIGELFTQPGSNYSYVYGQMAALALLERFEDDPEDFGAQFSDLLRAGDTESPADLLASIGLHTTERGGWQRAAATLREQIARLRDLTAEEPPVSSVSHHL